MFNLSIFIEVMSKVSLRYNEDFLRTYKATMQINHLENKHIFNL